MQALPAELAWIDWLTAAERTVTVDMLAQSSRQSYPPAGLICSPEERPNSVFLLSSGLVRIYRLAESGGEATFGFVQPGEVFGELTAFGDYSRDSFATAMRPSTVWKIPRRLFQSTIASNPPLVLEIARQIIGRFKRLEHRVETLMLRGVRERVIQVMLELARDLGQHDIGGVQLDAGLTQADLATLVGATRQTVNSCLHDLEKEGLIALSSKSIRVLRPDRLAALAQPRAMSASRQTSPSVRPKL